MLQWVCWSLNQSSSYITLPQPCNMNYMAADDSVFQIEDEDDLASMPEEVPDPKQTLLTHSPDTAELVVGTAGCCGAVFMLYCCLCRGLCHDESIETYNKHTLCGRWWCPV